MGILDSIDLEQYLPEKLPDQLKASKRKVPLSVLPFFLPVMRAYETGGVYAQVLARTIPPFAAV
jgi:hypothetical protein